MRLKISILILVLLLLVNIINAREVECRTTTDSSEVEECENSENCYLGSSDIGYLVCYVSGLEEEIPEEPEVPLPPEVIPEVPVTPREIPSVLPEDLIVIIEKLTENEIIINIEKEQEKAKLKLKFIGKDIGGGRSIEVPKLDLDLDIKKLSKIPQYIDVKKAPYLFYSLLILLFALLILTLFTVKDILRPKLDFRSKKGQIFLIAAIIFVLALYSVVIPYNTIKTYPVVEDFKDLSENYEAEYPKVFNWAVYRGIPPVEATSEFTDAFLDQARSTDPNFGIFYLFKDSEGNVHVVNTLSNKALIVRLTNIRAEELQIHLLSSDTSSDGEICISGIGSCMSTSSALENYGAGYDNQETLEGVESICFSVPDLIDEQCLLPDDFDKFTSMVYQETREVVETVGEQNIAVTLTQY